MTWIAYLIGLIALLLIATAVFVITKLFQQTDVVGVLKWGFLLVSISMPASGRRKD